LSNPHYQEALLKLKQSPKVWLVTGVAGFIGSNLLERLLLCGQTVVGLDNLSTGSQRNLSAVQSKVSQEQWSNLKFILGDIVDPDMCLKAAQGCDYMLHHAAFISVPESVEKPKLTFEINVTGTNNIFHAAQAAACSRVVYASTSAVYGDCVDSPLVETSTGNPLSPYADSKAVNEVSAAEFLASSRIEAIGLRYFNVYGQRQDPSGAYSAVVPKWITALLNTEPGEIFGDGSATRDFVNVNDVVQANILAAVTKYSKGTPSVFNIASGQSVTTKKLYNLIQLAVQKRGIEGAGSEPVFVETRAGDIHCSEANIDSAEKWLRFSPEVPLESGLFSVVEYFSK